MHILNHVMSLSLLWRHENFEYALPKEVSTKCRRKNSFKMWNIRISWGLKISAFEFILDLKTFISRSLWFVRIKNLSPRTNLRHFTKTSIWSQRPTISYKTILPNFHYNKVKLYVRGHSSFGLSQYSYKYRILMNNNTN